MRHHHRGRREQLLNWARRRTCPHRLVVRSRIVLMAAEGFDSRAIAAKLHVAPATVRLWCQRFHRQGLAGLANDAPGRGRKRGMASATVTTVLRLMLDRPRDGRLWTARSLAARAGTSPTTVWRVWRRYGVGPTSPASQVRGALGR